MVLVDTSVLVDVLRDSTGANLDLLFAKIGDDEIAITRAVEMEVLAGAKDDQQWANLARYLAGRPMLEHDAGVWTAAARLFFDCQRAGKTIQKLVDCCIAQIALDNGVLLVHNDRDFDAIATVRSLKHLRLDLSKA